MSDLKYNDRILIEKLFGMNSGHIMDLSIRQLSELVEESTGIDIYDEKYNYSSGSKANRLRAFFKKESNKLVGQLLDSLLEYWLVRNNEDPLDFAFDIGYEDLHQKCCQISLKLNNNSIEFKDIQNIDDLKLLYNELKKNLNDDFPQLALDRLHTFLFKIIRNYCSKYYIDYEKNESLNALFGKYVKFLKESNKVESKMTIRILKSFISIIDSFNDIRNNKSFAHDNSILNYDESLLICNNVISIIEFLNKIESKEKVKSMPW